MVGLEPTTTPLAAVTFICRPERHMSAAEQNLIFTLSASIVYHSTGYMSTSFIESGFSCGNPSLEAWEETAALALGS